MDLFPPYFLKIKKKSYKITKSMCLSLKNETMSETVQKKVILGVRVPYCKRDTGRDLALTTLEITTFSAPGYLITCIYINVNVIFSGNLKKSYLLNACPSLFQQYRGSMIATQLCSLLFCRFQQILLTMKNTNKQSRAFMPVHVEVTF